MDGDNETSVNEKRSVLGLPVSETILLAAAPVFAYVLTFLFQAGYCDVFELPHEFISVSLTDVLNIVVTVLMLFFIVLGVINMFASLLPAKIYRHPSLAWRMSALLLLFLLVIPVILFPGIIIKGAVILVSMVILIISLLFLPPLFTRRFPGGSYLQRMEALDNLRLGNDPWEGSGSLVYLFVDVFGRKAFLFAVYLLMAMFLTYSMGRGRGINRKVFPIANTTPETVVLFMTSERLITAPFDRTNKTVHPVFRVINFDDQTDLTLQLGKVGPLKLVPMKP